MRSAFAPGRVNLIGDHTDYTGGYVLPIAIQLGTTVTLEPGGDRVFLRSGSDPQPADLPLEIGNPWAVRPAWARYVAGVIAEIRPAAGGIGNVTTDLPVGEGLSSSAALEVATALALGFAGAPEDLALACQRAEQRAVGVPCGVMDQLASVAGEEGHALLIDCSSNSVTPVPLPDGCEVVVVPSGERRSLATSSYAQRRRECEEAASFVGPLREATLAGLSSIPDPVIRRRARHVVMENERVLAFAEDLRRGELGEAGELMNDSHRSLRDDFAVSTRALDDLVTRLVKTPGVYGARLTGAGFGGSVVALTRAGTLSEGTPVRASAGARVL
jgi:galactokinase